MDRLREMDGVIEKFGAKPEALISIMHEIQKSHGVISDEAIRYLSDKLCVPVSRIYGVASYYRAFSLEPKGRHVVQVCDGTSCHLKGAGNLLNRLVSELKTGGAGTSENGRVTLEKVRCQGCCQLSPVLKIDDTVHGSVTQEQAVKLIEEQK